MRAAAARGHLARQQLPARRLGAAARARRCAASPALLAQRRAHDRDRDRARGRRHLRPRCAPAAAAAPARSCRSTSRRRPASRCRRALPDTGFARQPLPAQEPSPLRPLLAGPLSTLDAAPGRRRAPSGGVRTAIVMRVTAHVRPASSLKRTSHTQVVRPRCTRVARRVHDALGDRAQEARVVRQAHRHLAFSQHRERGRDRGQRLGDRRVHAAVHEPRGLLELIAHRAPARAPRVLGEHEQLEAVEPVEARAGARSPARQVALPSRRHDSLGSCPRACAAAGRRSPRATPTQHPQNMSRLDELPPDQRAALSLLLRQRKSYAEVAATAGHLRAAVHDRAHAALAVLAPQQARELTAEQRAAGRRLPARSAARRRRAAAHAHATRGSEPARAWARELLARARAARDARAAEMPSPTARAARRRRRP